MSTDQWSKIIEAISSLMWPVIVLVVILRFAPTVRSIIESARWRKFTLKVGGQELTMEEINEQQRTLIADLQTQVASLQTQEVQPAARAKSEMSPVSPSRRSVLWVDDNPKNNSFLVQTLQEKGVEVDLALSSAEGLQQYRKGRYSVLLSDMGREEEGHYRPSAGIELLRKIRERDKDVPFIIYCSATKAREYREEAIRNGAYEITSSPTVVFAAIRRWIADVDG